MTLRPVLASTDLAVGRNRLVFALLDPSGAPIKASAARLTLSRPQESAAAPYSQTEAAFRPWPGGPGGVFSAWVEFPQAGTWLSEITPVDGKAQGDLGRLVFPVKERSASPALGAPAPRSQNRVAREGAALLEEVTSDPHPDPDLYTMTIAEALTTGKPLVVTFATPAFCTSATCGPQVDAVKELKNALGQRANFIHVEIYDNPKEMEGDISKARLSPIVQEWNLPSEPWTFIVDSQGRIAAKFEGFASSDELREALEQVLTP